MNKSDEEILAMCFNAEQLKRIEFLDEAIQQSLKESVVFGYRTCEKDKDAELAQKDAEIERLREEVSDWKKLYELWSEKGLDAKEELTRLHGIIERAMNHAKIYQFYSDLSGQLSGRMIEILSEAEAKGGQS